ncbi:excinuclease ABC subunit UvrA [Candidatus Dactylopiibacterium carminicum]|uniref:UvrABC system protein A n=1 Tax=Candidatus Dactylopiibacterium carminicum TaxID=857335 RepID=A0ABQ7HPT1_9RHOO|nr:excinuclease ABC subunit UvrA [Candidatus Dactylopiibacterium carminicum]KAF7599201.1 excinuclease ABC subunit UvrA [Candidatus Dactylopiibacterium carminicum]PAS99216.1 MAG: excinuclease ABC subunit A [Candidatus Dactylopiibacterium carminicum]
MDWIRIRGARTHNLKSINLDIPRNRLTVITGLSGSGKSSLAFDTLYAEGQRRYVESLSAYARQFLQLMEKPDVDLIEGLSPAISIEQKAPSHNPRSTVGTITEIHDYLRLLFARAGTPHCPDHQLALEAQSVSQMVDHVLALPEGTALMIAAPMPHRHRGQNASEMVSELRAQGFVRLRVAGETFEMDQLPEIADDARIELVVDRVRIRPDTRQRLAESFETALAHGEGRALAIEMESGREYPFSALYACPSCGFAIPTLEPRMFSFNSPSGACQACDGLGTHDFFDPARVVAHPELSLAGGAIRGWDRRNQFYFQMLQSLAAFYDFDIEAPFGELPEAVRHVVLYGSGSQAVPFRYLSESGRSVSKSHSFEGIISNFERRYRETDSTAVREELGKLRATRPCPECHGSRLRREIRHVLIGNRSLPEIGAMPIAACHDFFKRTQLPGHKGQIADRLMHEISARLQFLVDVGLHYLSLNRSADTLSGGEAQRIRLASQIGSGLTGVMYVLDEPSIGLHQRDNDRLLGTLQRLRDLGNSVIVVEHDEDAIRLADHVIDMGPGAGEHGGEVIAFGSPADIEASKTSVTGAFLSGRCCIAVPQQRRAPDPERMLEIRGARGNNLKQLNLQLPVGLLTCVTGVSGSGKSTLINDTLYAVAARHLNGAGTDAAPFDSFSGLEHFDKVINVDQAPIGRTPRSNPATYTGLLTPIRELFAGLPEARARGYGAGRFSFNVKGGRCEACQGDGMLRVEMHFLPDVFVPCDVCHGKRYNRETLKIRYKGKSIADIFDMTVEEASRFFEAVPSIARKLDTLLKVGLGYIRLGQSATTLSGGEAQRVKLALELSRRDTGRTLYILDEPTTGLHFHDIELLLRVLQRLREHGNTIVVIEHNLDVIKTADWLIDLGPEGGNGGGQIVATGSPEAVAANATSHTGHYLKRLLS